MRPPSTLMHPPHRPPARRLPGLAVAWALVALGLVLGARPVQAGLPEALATIKPSVVAVGTYDALTNPRFSFRGTGFIVGDGRLLATNAHVLPEETALRRRLVLQIAGNRSAGGEHAPETRQLMVLAVDPVHDLALLQISGEPLPAATLAAEGAREGQAVAFTGFPIGGLLGFSPVTHRAGISSITPIALPPPNARQLDAAAVARLRQGPFDIYQLDGTAYPGNSGGPLFDAETGQVIGVVNMVLVKGSRESVLSQPSGISYAIPVRFLRELLAAPR
jgi:S1-C subfamily serine protease